ncbi:MAG: ParB N-terminal domain-containing protein, partial [Polyangiales bacterium]
MATASYPKMMKTAELSAMAAPYNPREMLDHDWDQLRQSLREFGCVQPVIVNKRTKENGWKATDKPAIVGGHQRVRAAGDPDVAIDKMPVEWVDISELKERQLNLVLNRTSGDWEEDALERALRVIEELGGGEALDFTGFDTDELEAYLGDPDGGGGGEGGGSFD